MKIRNAKLSKEAVRVLRRIPVQICAPFEALMAPIYVYLPKNGKFVAVKLPLQHFTPQEIEKFKPYENFYLPEFVDLIAPFQKAGESIRQALQLQQKRPIQTNEGAESVAIPVSQHELDDAVLGFVGPLWNSGLTVEPFFLCFLANEVCQPFTPELITESIEKNTDDFELALLRSAAGVFLALHIGYSDARTLTRLREKFFNDTMTGSPAPDAISEIALLQNLVWTAIPGAETQEISSERIRELLLRDGTGGKAAKKLLSRLKRVDSEFVTATGKLASLFGEKGICDE